MRSFLAILKKELTDVASSVHLAAVNADTHEIFVSVDVDDVVPTVVHSPDVDGILSSVAQAKEQLPSVSLKEEQKRKSFEIVSLMKTARYNAMLQTSEL